MKSIMFAIGLAGIGLAVAFALTLASSPASAAAPASAATAAEARGSPAGEGQRAGGDDQRHREGGEYQQREAPAPAHAAVSRSGPMPGSDWTMCWSAW